MAAKSRGTRKSTLLRRNAPAPSVFYFWVKRVVLVMTAVVLVVAGGLAFLMNGGQGYVGKYLDEKWMKMTADSGYRIDNIMLEGRTYTDVAEVLSIVRLEKGDPIFRFDPVTAKKMLEGVAWIKDARVERRLPDTIYIKLTERVPFALWQKSKKELVLIDQDGIILTDKNLNRFENLMMIRGEGAPLLAHDLAQMLGAEPVLKDRLDHAIRIENRRWDLVLKDGKVIKLPEKDMGLAMRNLVQQNDREGILDKALSTIDVRDPARLIVRTDIGKAQDYNASLAVSGKSL
jgi:cell division protein FtsQ